LALAPIGAFAWSGTDQNGNSVEIGRGETVRPGRDIEVEIDGNSTSLSVDSIQRRGGRVEIEGTDDSGNSVTLDMEAD
jgi:hypothetical protein